jgi:hypothetical protein
MVSVAGNLNVLGIFDTIHAESVPVPAPPMMVVYTIRVEAGDPSPVGLTVEMVDHDGGLIVKWNSGIIGGSPAPGRFAHLHLILPFPGDLEFPRFSSYRVRLLAGDDYSGCALFQVACPNDP